MCTENSGVSEAQPKGGRLDPEERNDQFSQCKGDGGPHIVPVPCTPLM